MYIYVYSCHVEERMDFFSRYCRVQLNNVTRIYLTSSDKDGDYIKCRAGRNIEITGIGLLPNVTISKVSAEHKHCDFFVSSFPLPQPHSVRYNDRQPLVVFVLFRFSSLHRIYDILHHCSFVALVWILFITS